MGTAILRSHDCLQVRLRNDAFALATSRVRSRPNSATPSHNFNNNRRCRRAPVPPPNHLNRDQIRVGDRPAKVPAAANIAIGQVKILKRGENNIPVTTANKQIRVSDAKEMMYAGSAFVTSPPPSFVPVPGFIGRNDAATNDLRRLLRLDLDD
ncbi:hypothetical protein RIF29_07582 [Crotalaria pallida]|uniref:Uncharacterized protein n=1 Tax=Crotalaria pallida TaxID=3830 RepID=A0AAN9J499_CROPI